MDKLLNILLVIGTITSAFFILYNTLDDFLNDKPLGAVAGVGTIIMAILAAVKVFGA
jgi:hypothetical protein